jgi:hypothetical protein
MGPCTVYHASTNPHNCPSSHCIQSQAGRHFQAFPGSTSKRYILHPFFCSFHQTSDFKDFPFHGTKARKENHPFCICCMWLSQHDDFGYLSSTLVFHLSVRQVEALQLAKGMEPLLTASFRFLLHSCIQNLTFMLFFVSL